MFLVRCRIVCVYIETIHDLLCIIVTRKEMIMFVHIA